MQPKNTANAIPSLDAIALHLRNGDVPAAMALATTTLAAFPGHSDVVNLLAVCYIRAGDFGNAIQTLTPQIGITPDHPGLHANLAYALEKTGELEVAIVHAQKALPLWRGDASVLVLAARLWMKLGDYERALQFIARAMIVEPQNSEAHVLHGHIHYRHSRFSDAINAYRTGLKLNPGDATCRLNLALAILGQGIENALSGESSSPVDSSTEI